ncbi:hypothetical protein OSH11_07055 [Kaistia dalseonensis]|uniref:DUF2764 family protein n=1 Tax=Kaistia dalseonensis TaxID=410840 RepID=A0ABU0H400_9HYPH|nr:hypothetical protein [Kaistia dalseonensis]MCX5494452.1 hypothetical protein [Kaistia dalseonensis]MDQ0437031.1 hypothetical protein [Kaistia dalseonensis]
MIPRTERYVMLMASLPSIRLLGEKALPINPARLTERMKLLEPEDRDELMTIASILSWNRIDTGDDDAAYVARAERILSAIRSATLREAALERLEIRTLIAALRRRHAGEEAPAAGTVWGIGRHVETIRRNWTQPDLGMARFYRWVGPAREKLEAGDSVGLERLILDVTWQAAARHEFGHEFDFEAVVFYLMRWQLADRWARYDADAAAIRFAELLDAALPPMASLEVAA